MYQATAHLRAVLATLIALYTMTQISQADDLASELARRSTLEGLGIVRSAMDPLWFDSQPHRESPSSLCACEPTSGSRYIRARHDSPTSTILDCIDNTEVMTIKVIVAEAKFARDNEHFAFVGRYWRSSQDQPVDLSLGLYYAELVPKLSIYMVIDPHIGRVRKTDELISAGQLSWAPDGKRFTYSWGHKVWVYSINSKTPSVLTEGETPN